MEGANLLSLLLIVILFNLESYPWRWRGNTLGSVWLQRISSHQKPQNHSPVSRHVAVGRGDRSMSPPENAACKIVKDTDFEKNGLTFDFFEWEVKSYPSTNWGKITQKSKNWVKRNEWFEFDCGWKLSGTYYFYRYCYCYFYLYCYYYEIYKFITFIIIFIIIVWP